MGKEWREVKAVNRVNRWRLFVDAHCSQVKLKRDEGDYESAPCGFKVGTMEMGSDSQAFPRIILTPGLGAKTGKTFLKK